METDLTCLLQGFAAFLVPLGPSVAGSFYGAMGGYYIEKFNDKSFYAYMLLCHSGCYPLVSLLQRHFDETFDARFSTRVTYGFRVIGTQLLNVASVIFWMHALESQFTILALGVWLGVLHGTILSSGFQMVSAMEPSFMIYARLGIHFAALLCTFVIVLFGFDSTSPQTELQHVLLTVAGFCALVVGVLGYLHVATDVFTKAYSRLAYDLPAEQNLHQHGQDIPRQITETTPLNASEAKGGVPSWVNYWQFGNGLSMAIEYYLASLVGFFGSSSKAQSLTLIRMCMHLFGRVGAFPVPYMSGFKTGPWHKVMATTVFLVVGLGGLCLVKAFEPFLWEPLFLTSWCSIPVIRTFTSSLVDVTTGSYVEVRDRKSVARMSEMICFIAVLIGLVLGQFTGLLLNHAHTKGSAGKAMRVHAYHM